MRRLFLSTSVCCLAVSSGLGVGLGVGLGGCDGTYLPPPLPRDDSVGRWVNRYPNDPNLLGVKVRQFPDSDSQARRYEGRHPARVIYVFKNGSVNQIDYEPDGKIRERGNIWYRLAPGDPLWTSLDPPPK